MDEEEILMRNFSKTTTKYQSSDSGKIIKSKRKFGIEVEMFNRTRASIGNLSRVLASSFGIEHDGSIEPDNGYGIEVVSPILKGSVGENAVVSMFKEINKLGFAINKTCGFHVHLDGDGFQKTKNTLIIPVGEVRDSKVLSTLDRDKGDYAFIVKNDVLSKLCERLSAEDGVQLISDEYLTTNGGVIYLSKEIGMSIPDIKRKGGVLQVDKTKTLLDIFSFATPDIDEDKAFEGVVAEVSSPNPEDYLCIVYGNSSLKNVLTLLYLHTVYSDVFMSMLPMSRRQDNLYCQSLSLGFSAAQIESIRSFTELEAAWYKTRTINETRQRKGERYDDSRYFTMNLHSLFAKYGTIEMRSHSATLDHNKALYWVAFNQEILDRIVSRDITIPILRQGISLFDHDSRVQFVKDVLGLRPALTEYMQQRIDYFKNNDTK